MATSSGRYTLGRGEEVGFVAPGLLQFLREASQASPQFNLEMREAAEVVADFVVSMLKSSEVISYSALTDPDSL